MKKKIILSILVISLLVTGCFNKKVNTQTDGYKFAEEYTSINGVEGKNGKKNRELTISDKNPFVYKTAEELVEAIDNKETFIVYFGFSTCPWCRSILEQFIKVLDDKKIKRVYYVDIYDIRDVKELDADLKVITTKEGTKGYMELLKRLDNVLDEYTLSTEDDGKIDTGEKRIYAPNIVAVSKGKALQLETGISDDLTDPYGELTDDIKNYAYNKFKCLIDCLEEDSNTCQKNAC